MCVVLLIWCVYILYTYIYIFRYLYTNYDFDREVVFVYLQDFLNEKKWWCFCLLLWGLQRLHRGQHDGL